MEAKNTLAPGLSKRSSLERIAAAGLAPEVIFDVGVATGTPDLYGVWPDVRYVMIEPLAESQAFMQAFVEAHPGSIAVQAAAGRQAGEGQLVVAPNLSGSSFTLSPKPEWLRAVPIVTIDEVADEHGLTGPNILKLDVQGYELDALAGAEQTVGRSLAVIAEVSLWADRKKRGMAEFADMVAWFAARGFVLYDIAQMVRRGLDGAITEMDLVFCPADSPLRAVASYKGAAQADATTAKRRRAFGVD